MGKYLVTGAGGFIGKEVVNNLLSMGHQVIAVYRTLPELRVQNEHLRQIECSMTDYEYLEQKISERDIDTCIHLAWEGSTGVKRANYELQLANVRNSITLIKTLGKMGVKRFVGAGTLAEYDVNNYHPIDGSTPNTISHYGVAKMALHYMSKSECNEGSLEHVWCYVANTYGEGNRTDNFVNFASKIMLMGKRASFTTGEQKYDFVYVKDTAIAIICAADKGYKNNSYYIGSGYPRKLKEYIRIIRDKIDPGIELYLGEIPFRGIELPDEIYDIAKLEQDTGFMPIYSFEETIESTIHWLEGEISYEKL